MTEHPGEPDDVEPDAELLAADVAAQEEDDDPESLAGEPADAPADSGRPEEAGG